MFKLNQIEPIENEIKEKSIKDRLLYKDIYETIEKYIESVNDVEDTKSYIIVGGNMSINLLILKYQRENQKKENKKEKEKRSLDDFNYELYSENALKHSNNLSNNLDIINNKKNVKQKFFIEMKTVIPYHIYIIKIDNRPIITFYTLSQKVPNYNLIQPIKVKSFINTNLLVISPEIHLIDIYRDLYLPSNAESWNKLLEYENKLFKIVKLRKLILGGTKEKIKKEKIKKEKIKKEKIKKEIPTNINIYDRKQIEQAILKQFISNNKNVVLIGDHALKMTYTKIESNLIIEIISKYPEKDYIQVKKIIHNTLKRDIPILSYTRNLYIMKDFRVHRTTIKIGHEKDQKDIMYIYNSTQYDLVPFIKSVSFDNKSFIFLGNPFVILRFILINIWIIRLILSQKNINEYYAKKRLDNILNSMINFRVFISKSNTITTIKNDYFMKLLFQNDSDLYLGTFEDDTKAIKIKASEMKKFASYYPREYLTYHESYRF